MNSRASTAICSLVVLAFVAVGTLCPWRDIRAQTQRQIPKLERLGYPAGTKLLILHADDIGVSHSENRASFTAYRSGAISSGSVLVPCPWFAEAAAFFREHPQFDVGVHLTLTAEWKYLRWGPVAPRPEVPSLFDAEGFLYHTVDEVRKRVDAAQAERELRAQFTRAKAMGINPSHVDMHMGGLLASKEIFQAYLRVAKQFGIPATIPFQHIERRFAAYINSIPPDEALVDQFIGVVPGVRPDEWDTFYTKAIENLQPGITQITVHLAYDDEEMQAVTIDHSDYDAAWRQRDLDFFTSKRAKELLEKNDVHLVNWRELGKLLQR